MGQSSLIHSPNTVSPAAAKKFIKLAPWWIIKGGGPVVPGSGVPQATTAPVASATSLSVAAAGVASVTTGAWTGQPTGYTYQWMRGATAIAGATAASYTLVAADVGASLTCNVTATGAHGSATAASNAIGPVTA
jgi:hypothetical protein